MAAGLHKDAVKLVVPTHAPQQGSATLFYAAVLLEVQHIQDTLSQPKPHAKRTSGASTPREKNSCDGEKAILSVGANESLASAIQLYEELHRLQRLDESILRTSNVTDILEAPPVLAPGPLVSGAASAVVRLKQLRAAFVSRSQQVNMAHSSYRCVSRHNDLYKTYVRTSDDHEKSISGDFGSPTTVVAVMGHVISRAPSAASITNSSSEALSPSSAGNQAHGQSGSSFSSFTSGCATDKPQQPVAAVRPQRQSSQRRISQSSNRRSSNQRSSLGSSNGRHSYQRNGSTASSKRNSGSSKRNSNISKGDTDSLCSACSASSTAFCSPTYTPTSPPDPFPLRSESFAEKLITAIPKRVRGGFFGLAGFFGRGRAGPPAPQPPSSHAEHLIGREVEAPLRRSLSEPVIARRRCGVDFGAEAAAAATRASYRHATEQMTEESTPTQGARNSREASRCSGDGRAAALRSRSEPPSSRGGKRDRTRRAGFTMASVEDVDDEEYFITADLTTRSDLFNSERQWH